MKHAQGDVVKSDEFTLDKDNIDQYLEFAVKMDAEIKWLNSINDLQYKLAHPETINDELYTEAYLERRLEKVKQQRPMTDDVETVCQLKGQLSDVNKEIDQVRPLVFDKEEGKKPENHERMSDLDDKRKQFEKDIDDFYGNKYPNLKKNMLKIYYMILEGCDIGTVISCFRQMKEVLLNNKTSEEAANVLMDESTSKYNLPNTMYDPIRSRAPKAPKASKAPKAPKG
jgi:hypothetical protein